ncbi:hypothetical protein MLD38_016451 [Melastoma candidum]|uniref:Uncharacterized protein n=1 Tax=Melastoma candidum TaxID=119954 RepID=A0ACB9QMH6_9MYRT|nr:hypothetical protein MLD38_016451 [Melastoma candidum]
MINPNATVRDVLTSDGWWQFTEGNESVLEAPIFSKVTQHLTGPYLLRVGVKDKPLWRDGDFSIAKAWSAVTTTGNVELWTKWVWLRNLSPRVSFIAWLLMKGRLRAADHGFRIGTISSSACFTCREPVESIDHALFKCAFAMKVWKLIAKEFEFSRWPDFWEDLSSLMYHMWNARGGKRIIKWWASDIPEESDSDETDLSEDEFDPEEFTRMRMKQREKQVVDSSDSTEDSDPSYSDIDVMDANTTCTLYADGSYIAHKEEGLLSGVVDKIGVRYKLEWRHTYASVWVRRIPEWVCIQKPEYQCEVEGERRAGTSSEIVPMPTSLKRKVRDWVVREAR